jgi:hypothetical protein
MFFLVGLADCDLSIMVRDNNGTESAVTDDVVAGYRDFGRCATDSDPCPQGPSRAGTAQMAFAGRPH